MHSLIGHYHYQQNATSVHHHHDELQCSSSHVSSNSNGEPESDTHRQRRHHLHHHHREQQQYQPNKRNDRRPRSLENRSFSDSRIIDHRRQSLPSAIHSGIPLESSTSSSLSPIDRRNLHEHDQHHHHGTHHHHHGTHHHHHHHRRTKSDDTDTKNHNHQRTRQSRHHHRYMNHPSHNDDSLSEVQRSNLLPPLSHSSSPSSSHEGWYRTILESQPHQQPTNEILSTHFSTGLSPCHRASAWLWSDEDDTTFRSGGLVASGWRDHGRTLAQGTSCPRGDDDLNADHVRNVNNEKKNNQVYDCETCCSCGSGSADHRCCFACWKSILGCLKTWCLFCCHRLRHPLNERNDESTLLLHEQYHHPRLEYRDLTYPADSERIARYSRRPCLQLDMFWLGLFASFVTVVVLLERSSLSSEANSATWMMHVGASKQIVMPALIQRLTVTATSSLAPTTAISLGTEESLVSIYQFPHSCPPLTGLPVPVEDEFAVELAPGDYQFDSFYLNSRSVIHLDVTQIQGSTNFYILRGENLLERIQNRSLSDSDEDKNSNSRKIGGENFRKEFVLHHFVQAGDGEETNMKFSFRVPATDTYTLLYDNPSTVDKGQLTIHYVMKMTSYDTEGVDPICTIAANGNLQLSERKNQTDYPPSIHPLCSIKGGPSARMSCIIVVVQHGSNNDGKLSHSTLVKIQILGHRQWVVLIMCSLFPFVALALLSKAKSLEHKQYGPMRPRSSCSAWCGFLSRLQTYDRVPDVIGGHQQQEQEPPALPPEDQISEVGDGFTTSQPCNVMSVAPSTKAKD